MLRSRHHFRNCSANEAIVVLKSVVLASTVLLGVLACRQPVSIGRGDPNACVPLVALLSQPTAVLALEWMPPNNREDAGHDCRPVVSEYDARFYGGPFCGAVSPGKSVIGA